MSGGGTLQQRTTYLISLTLVKVEAVEENGAEAKHSTQGKEVEAGEGGREGGEAVGGGTVGGEAVGGGTMGGEAVGGGTVGGEAVGGGTVGGEAGGGGSAGKEAGGVLEQPQGAEDVAVGRRTTEELQYEEKQLASLPGSEEPPCDLSTPLPAQRVTVQKRTCSTPEVKPCQSPSLVTPPSVEGTEPGRTPTRTGLQIRPAGQRPVSLLKSHSSVAPRGRESREGRERSPTSAQSLDRKDCRVATRSPGPCRASWAEASRPEGWRDLQDQAGVPLEVGGGGIAMLPRKERLKSGSTSLPAPPTQGCKPSRKGKSRTLDNSDLNSLSEDLALARDGQHTHTLTHQGQHAHTHTHQGQRASAKDRKMLKFISGIFTKSSSGSAGSSTTPPPVYIQRDSSEEEVNLANSQEFSLSRAVPELRLGILGSPTSGKSALVNKYISGSYVALERSEGARFKKEVLLDGQSHLLLIREEAGPPDAQFSSWVDAVVLVFSLENEASFQDVYQLYSQLSSYRRDVPVIVVGTQDKISSSNPRVIEDQRARQLCIDVRHSLFYETCATYGFNVDRVFSEAAQKIVAQKKQAALQACKSLPNSPSHSGGSTPGSASFPGQAINGLSGSCAYSLPSTPVVGHRELRVAEGGGGGGGSSRSLKSIPRRPSLFKNRDSDKKAGDSKDAVGLRGVPIKQSILWKRSGSSLNKEWKKKYVTLSNNGTLSYHSSANDYMQNIHGKDIDLLRVTVKVPGKRPPRAVAPAGPSPLPPAVTPSSTPSAPPGVNGLSKELTAVENTSTVPQLCPSTLSVVDDRSGGLSPQAVDRGLQRCPSSLSAKAQSVDALEGAAPFSGKESSQSSPMSDRKKNRRKKSMNQKGDAAAGQAEAKRKMWKLKSFGSLRNINKTEEENADFLVVSFTGQSWHFEAPSLEERDSWVSAIESQILASLQSCDSGRSKARRSSHSEAVALQGIRNAKGNGLCVDCDAPNPTWASLNLGALICIECSGIHRNLGTHLSRVRSLDLDDWPGELTQVLAAIGNVTANSIWERCTQGRQKPTPQATREERESWIRAKYELRAFVAPLQPDSGPAVPDSGPTVQDGGLPTKLLSAVTERDLPRLLLLLAHSTKEQINGSSAGSSPTHSALHAACQLGDVVMTQLLVWYGIDVKAKDPNGQTAIMIARKTGSKGCIDILLQHGCPSEASPGASTPLLARRSSTASLGRTGSRKPLS